MSKADYDYIERILLEQTNAALGHYIKNNPIEMGLTHYLTTYCREKPLLGKYFKEPEKYLIPALVEAGSTYTHEVMEKESK